MVHQKRIDSQAMKLIVSVPCYIWASEITLLGRTLVRIPLFLVFYDSCLTQFLWQLSLVSLTIFAMHRGLSIDTVIVATVSREPV